MLLFYCWEIVNFDIQKINLFHMKKIFISILASICSLNSIETNAQLKPNYKILLIGDSTTEGGKGILDTTIQKVINTEKGEQTVEVYCSSRGGETAFSLFESGRYEREIKMYQDIDYIFVRYGINDFIKRKPFKENFNADMNNLISNLKLDFPKAKIILMTIIPFLDPSNSKKVNNIIRSLASDHKLELFDIYLAYEKALEKYGTNSMNIRFFPLKDIPEKYKGIVTKYSSYVDWKKQKMVRINTNELDPILGNLDGWYKDKHPNPTGYRLIALETINYILPKLN